MKIKDGKHQEKGETLGQNGACVRKSGAGFGSCAYSGVAIILVASVVLLSSVSEDKAQAGPAPLFESLYSFTNGADGGAPFANLILSGTTLYGTTTGGGTNGTGTVFAINTDGTGFRALHTFGGLVSPIPNDPSAPPTSWTNINGASPAAGLALSGNTLYGVAAYGGTNADGTLFAVNTDAPGFRVLHTFGMGAPYGSEEDSDGSNPSSALTLADGTLYGVAFRGGTNGNGTVFAVKTDGTEFTTLRAFNGVPDGEFPDSSLVLFSNSLYGMTLDGGTNDIGTGTVFTVNTNGTGLSALYAFSAFGANPPSNSGGANPGNVLVLSGSILYGTTEDGGTNSWGTVFAVHSDGTDFKLLHTFSAVAYDEYNQTRSNLDGAIPLAVTLCGKTLYGTASEGGTNADGTVFAVNTDGTGFTVIHTFNDTDGAIPESALVLSGNTLYGTTVVGGTDGAGTIFAITLPSIPAIASNSVVEIGGQLQFKVCGLAPGATVYVQASSNLSLSNNWVAVSTNVATGTNLTISGLSVTNANYGFFRVVESYPP